MRDSTRGSIYNGAVWKWVNEGADEKYQYVKATELNALTGYWVYAEAPVTITVTGIPVADPVLELMFGWNLIGCPVIIPVPDAEQYDLRVRCWQWDADVQRYEETDKLRPCRGYWLNAGSDDVELPLNTSSQR